MRLPVAFSLIASLSVGAASAQGESPRGNAQTGKQLFESKGCYSCHGFVGQGSRDSTYAAAGRAVEWHHHFSLVELEQLAGSGWRWMGIRRGGLVVYPLMDWLSWPFYRLKQPNNPVRRWFQRVAEWEYGIDFGAASYGVLIALERVSP